LLSPPVNPLDEVSQNHVPVDARHTIKSFVPSPSMSPLSGTSPRLAFPHAVPDAPDVVRPVVDESHVHAPVDGRQTVRSVRWSPSRSGAVVDGR
jgi:hypothetical protein